MIYTNLHLLFEIHKKTRSKLKCCLQLKKLLLLKVNVRQKLKNKDGDFQNRIFDFAITRDSLQETVGLAEDGNIHFNFDLDFGYSEFQTIDVGSYRSYIDSATKVRFSGKVNFKGATFSGKVNFKGATFSDIANFHETTFSDIANFHETTFSGEVNFWQATFSDIAIFWQATFSEANFFKATFSGEADFSKATFSDIANFFKATFSKKDDFSKATFSGKADFSKATFSEANFIGATFKGGVDFIGATFSEANFWETTFKGEADFSKATFSGKAKFIGVTFLEKAFFYAATFSEKAKFIKATFSEIADFSGARFSEEVYFNAATFSRVANFNNATFSEEAHFSSATFSEKAFFYAATFSEEADFTNTIFLNEVQFRRATFSQDHHTYFCNLNLKQKYDPDKRNEKETHPAPRLQFRDTIFPKLVLFSNCNLSQTTFESCTIAGIKFRSCEFTKTGFFIFKRNAFENRTRQKSFWKNFCLALRLEGRLLKKAFSKNEDEIKKEVKELEKNNEKLHSIELETEEKRKDREDICCQMKTALESSKRWSKREIFILENWKLEEAKTGGNILS